METSAAATDPRRYLALAGEHYENFPVGSWLLPKRARLHLHRIYAFARTADDLADEWQDGPALAAFRGDFLAHLSGARRDVPLFVDLVASIRDCELEPELFTALLDAFEQDLTVKRFDRAGLLAYCQKSADPVGRLVLRVCGYRDAGLDALSDRICTALQLVNHLQDMGSDLKERDRVYFPQEDLQRYAVTEDDLRAPSANGPVRALVRHWAGVLAADFAAGWPLCARVKGRLRLELRAILRSAGAVLARIAAVDGDVLGGSVHLSRRQRLGPLLMALCTARPPRILRGPA